MEDAVAPAKIISDFIKETEKTEIKAGVLEGKVVDVAAVKALASLPSREVLLAKVLGSMNAPITGFVTALSGNIRNLLYVLNAIKSDGREIRRIRRCSGCGCGCCWRCSGRRRCRC